MWRWKKRRKKKSTPQQVWRRRSDFLNKIVAKAGMAVGIFLGAVVVAYAITNLFFMKSVSTSFTKKQIFQFNLNTGLNSAEVGPGDSFPVNPVIYNDATEDMFVFIQVDMPFVDGSPLYTFEVDRDWTQVESSSGTVVYAYGSEEMSALTPGESTSALTNEMTMRSITNAEYADIDDINITIIGYAVGTDGVSATPAESWNECKLIGNIP